MRPVAYGGFSFSVDSNPGIREAFSESDQTLIPRSGTGVMPLSTIATPTLVPSYPCCQTAGALMGSVVYSALGIEAACLAPSDRSGEMYLTFESAARLFRLLKGISST